MTSTTATASCPARAALAGNPSDLHRGAVVATPVRSVAATVTVTSADRFEIAGLDRTPSSLEDLDRYVADAGRVAEQPLVAATIVTLHRALAADVPPVRVEVETTIPRNVGLAGSSAIVIATIRALVAHRPDRQWARALAQDPWLLATTALEAETSVLGIAAGPQDRVVQAIGDAVVMDFADWEPGVRGTRGTHRVLGALPGVGFVACRPDLATESGSVHRPDRTSPPPPISLAASDLARLAEDAAEAIDARSVERLGAAMDATFDLRRRHMELEDGHVEMIDAARSGGAFANYTGSGGAIIALGRDRDHADTVASTLRSRLGCTIIALA